MATFLYRLGRLAFRRRGRAVLLWLAALAAVGVAGLTSQGTSDGDLSMPGIESQHAYDLIQQRFPGAAADGATAQVVFVAPGGEKVTASDNRAAVEHAVSALGGGPQVAGVADPFTSDAVSKDGSTAYATVSYEVAPGDLTDDSRAALDKAADQARAEGLTVETGGSALEADEGPGGTSELIGIAVAALVLLVTFGSLTAAGMPLLTAVAGAAVSLFGILALGHPLGLTSDTLTLGMMLGLAVGTRELHDAVAHHMAVANAQAGTAAHLAATRPEQAREILTALVGTTSSALLELRATVGVLRQAGDTDTGSLEPTPGLGRLPDLVAACRSAGLDVTVSTTGQARPLTPGVDLTAYRIVQEALTNATKHAAGHTARVGLDYGDTLLRITVADDGPPLPPVVPGGGYGLMGMRERAHSVGGDLHAGPRPEGGFGVTATLPVQPPAADPAEPPGEAPGTRRQGDDDALPEPPEDTP